MATEDKHFYIDDAPPVEVAMVLRVLTEDRGYTSAEIAEALSAMYGFDMQKDRSYSPRRLHDLKLAEQYRDGIVKYRLTPLGTRLQILSSVDSALGFELLHYLHYTSASIQPEDRKLFWSYRRLCDHVWIDRQVKSSKSLASQLQADISQTFEHIDDSEKEGGRFSSSGVNQGLKWLRVLQPSPLDEKARVLLRPVSNPQLLILALDDLYRHNGFSYGGSVVVTDEILDKIARVFFFEPSSCRESLASAAALSPAVQLSDTLAGMSVALTRPYSILDL